MCVEGNFSSSGKKCAGFRKSQPGQAGIPMKKIYKVGIPVILRAKESVSRNCEIIIK